MRPVENFVATKEGLTFESRVHGTEIQLQWRDRAGFSPASSLRISISSPRLLAEHRRCQGNDENSSTPSNFFSSERNLSPAYLIAPTLAGSLVEPSRHFVSV